MRISVHSKSSGIRANHSRFRSGHRHLLHIVRISFVACCVAIASLMGAAVGAGYAAATPSQWSITPSPDQLSSQGFAAYNVLNSVSCSKETYCEAVGAGPNGTLVETWNGTSWSIVSSPDGGYLNGVSCTSSAFCVAVGETPNGSGSGVPLILNDGQVMPVPDPGSGGDGLNGVSCTSSSNCVAVGAYFDNSLDEYLPLIESWNGSSWSVVPNPNAGDDDSTYLESVSCTSSTSCMAVGDYANTVTLNFAEEWNGEAWSITPTPNKTGKKPNDELSGVSCTSSTNCMAVGSYKATPAGTLVESWNGTRWEIMPSPDPTSNFTDYDFEACNQTGGSLLCSISCSSSTNCVAVGTYHYTKEYGGHDRALIESWNGRAWSVTPNPKKNFSEMFGASCSKASSCVAVGNYSDNHLDPPQAQNLIETGT